VEPPTTSAVVTATLAQLDAELAELDGLIAGWQQPADERLTQQVLGLLDIAASSRDPLRRTALLDLQQLGPRAAVLLESIARAKETSEAGRFAATEALFQLGSGGPEDSDPALDPDAPARGLRLLAAQALGRILKESQSAPLRARLAWYLGRLDLDVCVPILCLRLKYELDSEAVLWLAWALARFENYAGLNGLAALAANPEDPQAGPAAALGQSLAEDLGVDSQALLLWTWSRGDPEGRLQQRPPSSALVRELWRWIAVFDQYQLRGVDDARFIFERLDGRAAPHLAAALQDQSPYVRHHAAQCLGRMGRRGAAGAGALQQALDHRETAAVAAEALGQIGNASARPALEARLAPEHGLELRVAAARGLAKLGLAESLPAVQAAFQQAREVPELQVVLAEALVYLRAEDPALPVLLAAWGDTRFEQRPIEEALEWLISARAAAEVDGGPASQAAERWSQAAKLPEDQRRADRLAAFKDLLPAR
jgi:HEAT repeats